MANGTNAKQHQFFQRAMTHLCRGHNSERRERDSIREYSNPQPLDQDLRVLPLCHSHCPTILDDHFWIHARTNLEQIRERQNNNWGCDVGDDLTHSKIRTQNLRFSGAGNANERTRKRLTSGNFSGNWMMMFHSFGRYSETHLSTSI